jgi:endoglucanase
MACCMTTGCQPGVSNGLQVLPNRDDPVYSRWCRLRFLRERLGSADLDFAIARVIKAFDPKNAGVSCAMWLCSRMTGGRALMRELLLCFSILFLLGDSGWAGDIAGSPVENGAPTSSSSGDARGHSSGQSGIVGKLRSGDDKSSTDTTWSQSLTLGVNGPIPVIVVDQFGYPTKASKIAVIRDPQMGYDNTISFTPGNTYAVVNRSTGKIVKKGLPIAWNGGATDDVSGDKAWWFDFSDVEIPGTYTVVDIDKGLRSVEFEIDDGVYRNVLKHAVRMFFYQRAGFEKTAETAGSDWADAASHMGRGQDPQARLWRGKPGIKRLVRGLFESDVSDIKDLHGGWFDAGDYNKYTSWAARNIIVLLRAYSESPNAFGDDTGIAESGNGVPDILDEVKWGLDWLVRMQNTDGSLLCVQGLDQASPPSAATGPSYYGPATTAASLMGAAAFAYAAKIYSARSEADLRAYGNDLATRAKRAWDWASVNPNVQYYNTDGLASGQQEMDDAHRLFTKLEAAVYLYELTGDKGYKGFVETKYNAIIPDWGPNQWQSEEQEALLYYTRLPGISAQVRSEILARFAMNVTVRPDQLPMITNNKDPYRSPIKDYTWASNQSKVLQARLYQLLALYGNEAATAAKADSAAMGYLHYIHGVNPLGLVYLTNMKLAGAEHSATTMWHSWFAHSSRRWARVSDTMPGPPPGYLVGGPNPGYSLDKCCTAAKGTADYQCHGAAAFSLCRNRHAPPLGQPPLKSYLDFNEDWPANSWEVTEPETGYQSHYIRVLARYVR